MKNIALLLLYICGLALSVPSSAITLADSTQLVLDTLDAAIRNKATYHDRHERHIARLKAQLQVSTSPLEQSELCEQLFNAYLRYQADSALAYVHRRQALASWLPSEDRVETIINHAEALSVMGMYNESAHALQSIDPSSLSDERLAYYFRTCRAYYGWLADYTANSQAKRKYLDKTSLYRDSILMLKTQLVDQDIVLAEKLLLERQTDKALRILDSYTCKQPDLQHLAFMHYTFAEAYETLGDTDRQIYHLAKSALCDIHRSAREYASLQKLALKIFHQGDVERAYRYLDCSMEDAVDCNARLRFLEVTVFYPIVEKAYQLKVQHEHSLTRILFTSVSILALLLVIACGYLYFWMKKLQVMRLHLYEANRQLVAANQSLGETSKIKDTYIANYLDRCVDYLEKLEQYRRSLEKLAMASKVEELFKAIRSEQFLRDERKNFYHEFDKSFLELFPHFIDDFNRLLTEDGKIFPKKNELLSTELRIFALIRLGVTDSTRIAHFLGYSLATVYNYRSKMRNRAIGDKEGFEQAVMNL